MGTLNLTIKSSKDVSSFKQANQDQENLNRIINLISGVAIGAVQATIDVQSSSADPVAATAEIEVTYASVDANDTVTICNTVLTAKASGAAAGTEFNKQTNATVTAANLVAAINANTTLSKLVVATSAAGVVTLTARQKGVVGNGLALSTSDGTAFGLTAFADGAGGSTDTAVSIAR
jgi:phage tail sheath gpL-like